MIQMFHSLENLCKFLQITTCYNLFIVIFFLLRERYYQFLQLCFTCFHFIHPFIHLVFQRSIRVDILIELVYRWLSNWFIPRGWRQNHHIPLVWTPKQWVLLHGPWIFNPYNQSHRHFPSWRTANTRILSTLGLASLTLLSVRM